MGHIADLRNSSNLLTHLYMINLVEIGPVVFEKKIFFLNFVNVFLLSGYHLPLEYSVSLHFNKLESPLHKYALCQVWLKFAQWFLSRRI